MSTQNETSDLLFSILCVVDGHEQKVKYLKDWACPIEWTCRVLNRLGLAEQDPQSQFGWKATSRLVNHVATQKPPVMHEAWYEAKEVDEAILMLLFELAEAGMDPTPGELEQGGWATNVLWRLGLIKPCAAGGYMPTRLMIELIVARGHELQEQEMLKHELEEAE